MSFTPTAYKTSSLSMTSRRSESSSTLSKLYTLEQIASVCSEIVHSVCGVCMSSIRNNMFITEFSIKYRTSRSSGNEYMQIKNFAINVHVDHDQKGTFASSSTTNSGRDSDSNIHVYPNDTLSKETLQQTLVKIFSAWKVYVIVDMSITRLHNMSELDISYPPTKLFESFFPYLESHVKKLSHKFFYKHISKVTKITMKHHLDLLMTKRLEFPKVENENSILEIAYYLEPRSDRNKQMFIVTTTDKRVCIFFVSYSSAINTPISRDHLFKKYQHITNGQELFFEVICNEGLHYTHLLQMLQRLLRPYHAKVAYSSFQKNSVEVINQFPIQQAIQALQTEWSHSNGQPNITLEQTYQLLTQPWFRQYPYVFVIQLHNGIICIMYLEESAYETTRENDTSFEDFHKNRIPAWFQNVVVPYKVISINNSWNLNAKTMYEKVISIMKQTIVTHKGKLLFAFNQPTLVAKANHVLLKATFDDLLSKEKITEQNSYPPSTLRNLRYINKLVDNHPGLYLLKLPNKTYTFLRVKSYQSAKIKEERNEMLWYNLMIKFLFQGISIHKRTIFIQDDDFESVNEIIQHASKTCGVSIINEINEITIYDRYENIYHMNISDKTKYPSSYRLQTLRNLYVSETGSKELNVSIMEFFEHKESVRKPILTRAASLMEAFVDMLNTEKVSLYNRFLYVYHGSDQRIHRHDLFVCCTFLSTTRSYSVASSYTGTLQVIYVIRIPESFPFLNVEDHLSQLLLPMGTHILVEYEIQTLETTFIFCRVQPYVPHVGHLLLNVLRDKCYVKNPDESLPMDFKYDSTVHKDMVVHHKELNTVMHELVSYDDDSDDDDKKQYEIPTGSSKFYYAKVHNSPYIFKDIVKENNDIRVLSNPNPVFARVLNEVLASKIYNEVYGLLALDLKIYVKDATKTKHLRELSPFLIASKKIDITYPNEVSNTKDFVQWNKQMLNGFWVDCILGSWDTFNNHNWGIYNDDIIRTDVGGSLLFKGNGMMQMSFTDKMPLQEHVSIARQSSFNKLVLHHTHRFTKKDLANMLWASYEQHVEHAENIRERLLATAAKFRNVVTHLLSSKRDRTRYQNMITQICDAVLFRHNYYKDKPTITKSIKEVIDIVFSDDPDHDPDVAHLNTTTSFGGTLKHSFTGRGVPLRSRKKGTLSKNVLTVTPFDFQQRLKDFNNC